jgi:hypothetical protein
MATNPNDPTVPSCNGLTDNQLCDLVYTAEHCGGLTKRELFAAMAMQGHMANPDPAFVRANYRLTAQVCVDMADAIIIELNKGPKP